MTFSLLKLFIQYMRKEIRSWYWSKFFPDVYKEGLTEMNSSVPKNVYVQILEEAKKNYLAATNDKTLDD